MPVVSRTVDIAGTPSAVWHWLTSQEALRQWMSPTIEIDLVVGGAYKLTGPEHGVRITGHVLEIVPEGSLILSWQEEGWAHPGRLLITLQPIATGCRVSLVHDGFAGIGKSAWRDTMGAYERGADRHRILHRLNEVVAGGAVA